MIRGFEEYTYDLTPHEEEMIPIIIDYLNAAGKRSAPISAGKLADAFSLASSARVRKVVNHIRINGLIRGLVANSKGYYVTNDIRELERYEKSLAERIGAINTVRDSIMRYRIELAKNEKAA